MCATCLANGINRRTGNDVRTTADKPDTSLELPSTDMKYVLPAIWFVCWVSCVLGQGYMPYHRLRKAPPVLEGGNDIYQSMEKTSAVIPDGMAVLYASSPIFSPLSKDPEQAAEVYAVLPESEAVQRGASDRRLLEDALLEMGFPLEELTQYDHQSGRVLKVTSSTTSSPAQEAETEVSTEQSTDSPLDVSAILDALQGPLPYVRRGAWGK